MLSYKKIIGESDGHFGTFGGQYVPELIMPIMKALAEEFEKARVDDAFLADLSREYHEYAGRPTPLYFCERLTKKLGGAKIYLKNEGLLHTGAHKINHCLGQALLAKRMGKQRLVAETGAGQHGLATATVAAKFGFECTVYMGAKDYSRQRPNVFWMERLGAEVVPVTSGGQVLKDAINAAIRDLIGRPDETHFLLGTVCGPHPYPVMNTFFQKIISEETRRQLFDREGRGPDVLVACIGGGSNAMGLFYDFLDEPDVRLIGVEAGGKGITRTEDKCTHAARFQDPAVGVVEGFKSYFLQDEHGQVMKTHSISAGLDYSGVGPQHAFLFDEGRIEMTYALDSEVLVAYELLAKTEGIFPALESAHALAEVITLAPTLGTDKIIVFNCSGRGDKDLFITAPYFDKKGFTEFLRTQI